MTLQKPVLLFILLYCRKRCFKLEQCKELIISQCRELRTEYCSESLLLLVIAFNTILKTVKQKITHCISVCLCSLHYYRWIFRTDRNYCSNCQKGKRYSDFRNYKNDAKLGNQLCSACRFHLSTSRFLKSTPSPFHVLHHISYCQPPRNTEGDNIMLQVLSTFESPNQSYIHIFPAYPFCCIPPHAPLPTALCLVWLH